MRKSQGPGSEKSGRADSGRDLRRLLIDAALRILDDPDTPLELRKVAEAAEKSRTAPYLVFGKESDGGGLSALRLAVAAEGAGMLAERMREARISTDDARLAFHRVATSLFDFATSRERLFRLMFGPEIGTIPLDDDAGRHPEFANLVAARTDAEHVVHDVMRQAQEQRILPQGDSMRHTIAAWALLIGVAFLLLDRVLDAAGVETSVEQGADLAVEVLMGAGTDSLTRAALALMAVQQGKEGKGAYPPTMVEGSARSLSSEAATDEFGSAALGDEAPGVEEAPPRAPRGPASAPPDGVSYARRASLFGLGAGRTRKKDQEEDHREDAVVDAPAGAWSVSNTAGPASASWSRDASGERPSDPASDDPAEDNATRIYEAASETIASYPSLRRAARMGPALKGAKILWIDDHPKGILWERRALEELGVIVLPAWSTKVGLERLEEEAFDLVISDIARGDVPDEGVRALEDLHRTVPGIPVIFYVARVDPRRGPPAGSVGITNQIDELLHLVPDVLERRRL